jgi:hypothetical protein
VSERRLYETDRRRLVPQTGPEQVIRSPTDMLEPSSAGRRPSTPVVAFAVAAADLGLAAWLILAGHRLLAGIVTALVIAVMVMASFDAPTPRRPRAAFLARLLDRSFEVAILAPIAWVARHGSVRIATLALVGLGASYVAAYERARGQSLGYLEREGRAYVLSRWLLLAFALLTGWVEASLWVFCAVTLGAGAVRAINVARQERLLRAGTRP